MSPLPAAQARRQSVLCVDLDGTLLKTDTLWESLIAAWKLNPWLLFRLPLWLARGRAFLKHRAARYGKLDPAGLPYDRELLAWLRKERDSGRTIVLATGASTLLARTIADHVGVFSAVLASDESCNLVGAAKLKKLCALFGRDGFEYVGDSRADLPIWRHLGRARVVGGSPRLRACLERRGVVVEDCGSPRKTTARVLLREFRVHQCSKNLLIFLPLLSSHRIAEPALWGPALAAFAVFTLVASGFYVFNDLLDVQNDRRHPAKRSRPIAAGSLSPARAVLGMLAALGAGLALAAACRRWFWGPPSSISWALRSIRSF